MIKTEDMLAMRALSVAEFVFRGDGMRALVDYFNSAEPVGETPIHVDLEGIEAVRLVSIPQGFDVKYDRRKIL